MFHMTNLTSQAGQTGFSSGRYPDGLDIEAIDALITDVYAEIANAPRPTSALMDGTAAERRRRRMARRAIASVVRSLPTTRPVAGPDEGEAA
jgi:hypothetical protein